MFKHKKLIIILTIILLLLSSPVIFIQQKYVVPILMYHSVTPDACPENRLAVTAAAFERQMRFLKKYHYKVLPLEEIALLIKDKKKIPFRTCAITFDDGYKDNYIYALPILKKYNLCATVFIIVNEVGRPDRLSWDEIKTMQAGGLIHFGSHALGPEPLVNIKSEEQLRKEIFESKSILEEKLGRKIFIFSYPEGRFNHQIKQLVKDAGYKFAVTTSPGKKFAGDDIFALKRLRISLTANNLFVFWIETSGFYTFIKEHRDED